MDTRLVIGMIVVVVVGFFAFQWWSAAATRSAKKVTIVTPTPTPVVETIAPLNEPVKEERQPQIDGQTINETNAKEPVQRPIPATNQQPVTYEGDAPAKFVNNLRRPEQAFHQPTGPEAHPTLQMTDLPSGRAATVSSPMGGHQQAFSPEMAQNGGAMIGNSVFAYDGMEPTEFTAF